MVAAVLVAPHERRALAGDLVVEVDAVDARAGYGGITFR
jgi:hypothetical protein